MNDTLDLKAASIELYHRASSRLDGFLMDAITTGQIIKERFEASRSMPKHTNFRVDAKDALEARPDATFADWFKLEYPELSLKTVQFYIRGARKVILQLAGRKETDSHPLTMEFDGKTGSIAAAMIAPKEPATPGVLSFQEKLSALLKDKTIKEVAKLSGAEAEEPAPTAHNQYTEADFNKAVQAHGVALKAGDKAASIAALKITHSCIMQTKFKLNRDTLLFGQILNETYCGRAVQQERGDFAWSGSERLEFEHFESVLRAHNPKVCPEDAWKVALGCSHIMLLILGVSGPAHAAIPVALGIGGESVSIFELLEKPEAECFGMAKQFRAKLDAFLTDPQKAHAIGGALLGYIGFFYQELAAAAIRA